MNARQAEIYRVEHDYLASRATIQKKVTCANDGTEMDMSVLGGNCKY